MFRISTRQARLSWPAVFAMGLPAGCAMFVEMCSANALTFTMRKFVADPALIAFLGSLNVAFNFLVAPLAAWKSDRLWTRWGRRKPFMLVGWSILALALAAVPFCPNIWTLTVAIILYQFGMDLGYTGIWPPLYFETIPENQRGRAVTLKRLSMMSARIFFFWSLIGQFDAVCGMKVGKQLFGSHAFSISGEKMIYFTAAGLVTLCVVGVFFFVKETASSDAESAEESPCPCRRRESQMLFERTLGDAFGPRRWFALGALIFCAAAATTDLGQLQPLLYVEQFGYTKAEMGRMMTWIILPEMFLVLPAMMYFADRIDRFKLTLGGLGICTFFPVAFWFFIKYAAPNQIPSPWQIVVAMIIGHLGRMIVSLSLEPLLFSFTHRNRMGTLNAGLIVIQGVLTTLLLNGTGLWVKGYAAIFPRESGYDYTSVYWYMSSISAIACVIAASFLLAEKKETKTPPASAIACG